MRELATKNLDQIGRGLGDDELPRARLQESERKRTRSGPVLDDPSRESRFQCSGEPCVVVQAVFEKLEAEAQIAGRRFRSTRGDHDGPIEIACGRATRKQVDG